MVAIDYSSVSNVHRIIRLNTTTQRLKPVLAIMVTVKIVLLSDF